MRTVLVLTVLAAVPASAQSFNIKAPPFAMLPSSSYGAATGQAGTWNSVPQTYLGPTTPGALVDLAGSATSATAATVGCDADFCTFNAFGPDVEALLGTYLNGDCYAIPPQTRIWGLQPGHYEATLYGSVCWPGAHNVDVRVNETLIASPTLSGVYNGSFASMQLGHFAFDLNSVGMLRITGASAGSWSALQLTHFEMPSAYCTAKVNSLGCPPDIGWSGTPSATASSGFVVDCANVLNQKPGILIYKVGGSAANVPFQGGTLCIGPTGIRRSPALNSGGSALPAQDCSGNYSLDMNAFAHGLVGGNPDPALLVSGSRVRAQWWGRDPGFAPPDNSMLSDAVEYDVRN